MRSAWIMLFAVPGLAAAAGSAVAQAASTCVEDPAHPVPPFWNAEARTLATTMTLRPRERVRLPLALVGEVNFAQPPERMPAADTRGAVVKLDVPSNGRWRVLLSHPGWVDMVSDGLRQASVAHGHWSRCAGPHKAVEYRLRQGIATLQISGVRGDSIDVLVLRAGD